MKSDAQIQQDVIEELQWRHSVNALNVGVGVHNGLVTLIGRVGSHREKWTAECAAKAVPEVAMVINEIDVRPNTPADADNVAHCPTIESIFSLLPATMLDDNMDFDSIFKADFEAARKRRDNCANTNLPVKP
jgi:hypothetical protein